MTRRFVDDVRRNSIQVRTQFIVRRESENIFTGRRGINPAIVEDCIRRHD
jgi:GTP cyclohydrolase FolE2